MVSDVVTSDGMVMLNKTTVEDNFVLKVLRQIELYLGILFLRGAQAMGRLWSQRSVTRYACAHGSGKKDDSTVERQAECPAVQKVTFPVSSTWFDRSNLLIELERRGKGRAFAEDLDTIGELIRTWRALRNYPRAKLAQDLGISVDVLLFLETGDGIPEDITLEQLQRLVQLCRDDEVGDELALCIHRYVDKAGHIASLNNKRACCPEHWLEANEVSRLPQEQLTGSLSAPPRDDYDAVDNSRSQLSPKESNLLRKKDSMATCSFRQEHLDNKSDTDTDVVTVEKSGSHPELQSSSPSPMANPSEQSTSQPHTE
jgi:ribosome-binding protein aMBF1 (putative translation factor)